MIFDLTPTDGHKSFCSKAKIVDDGNTLALLSYGTKVAVIDKHTGRIYGVNCYSVTTTRHLVAFFATFQDVWQGQYPDTTIINKAYIVKNFTRGDNPTPTQKKGSVNILAKMYSNFYSFYRDYETKVHDHFFDHDTLKFFGERLSEMRLLKGTSKIIDNMGDKREVYVISSYQHKAPKGLERTHHYFDVETLQNIIRKSD